MKVNCLSCGHVLDLRDAYDDYEGQIKCYICRAVLKTRTEDGQVKMVDFPGGSRPAPAQVLEKACEVVSVADSVAET